MAKSKKGKDSPKKISISDMFCCERPKVKLTDEKVKALEVILKDEALKGMSTHEMTNLIDAYKSGKNSKK